jgi:hypothetical protein
MDGIALLLIAAQERAERVAIKDKTPAMSCRALLPDLRIDSRVRKAQAKRPFLPLRCAVPRRRFGVQREMGHGRCNDAPDVVSLLTAVSFVASTKRGPVQAATSDLIDEWRWRASRAPHGCR